jgi:hypothetical protein
MSKMGLHDPFGYLKHKLCPKERSLKVNNRHDSLASRWHSTYCWKGLDEGYNLALNLASIRRLHTKLWASKIMGVPIREFQDSNL